MARTACGKNGNTADPSFHGHSTLHPVAGNGLGGLLCSAGAPDLVAAECLSLRNISTGKETTLQFFMVLQVRDPPIGRLTVPQFLPQKHQEVAMEASRTKELKSGALRR